MNDTGSNTTTTSVIVNVNEYEFLKEASYLTAQDVESIIENKDLIEKFINNAIRNIRYGMLNLQFKTKEEIQIQINTLIQLREGLEKTKDGYKQYLEDQAKEKELKETDIKTEEEKKTEEEIIKIKKTYNI